MSHADFTPAEIAARYLRAWNEPEDQRRRALVAEVFTPDARYVDPLADVAGHEGLNALIAGMQSKFAGARFALKGTPDAHHDRVRFSWSLDLAGKPLAQGTDVAVTTGDGRLQAVTGFLDFVSPDLS